mmetsp:Transcript_25859/g.72162  ORF Transcript_25859/g.72162 Transcript_25859/m.72162 type:complete len:80 (-) Transcript_25859:98-337(-)
MNGSIFADEVVHDVTGLAAVGGQTTTDDEQISSEQSNNIQSNSMDRRRIHTYAATHSSSNARTDRCQITILQFLENKKQ